ncbi:hypothetical protein [Burkholderia vietnamiensis]|uniref:hypothetical protein n=1 Tax=Burkholderia vietnamiensis TaxID=60552 RepID=UPI002DD43D85|nr:hypothetical protein [Burkholderia vietnamiensis]MEC4595492.1 hypothetical protein [Burkholderia vietnamiensis]
MTTDNEKGPLNQMESGQEKRSASEARALSEIVNGTPSENLCRRGSPAPEQASETTAQQPRTYTTQPAESVMGIALRQCGNEMEWRHILACNPEFARMLPHEYFPVGTVLNLPPHPAAASRFEQPEKSLAPEGGSEARGRWIQANCPTGDIIKSPSPSNNREFPTSMSELACEHRIALAPSQPAAAPIDAWVAEAMRLADLHAYAGKAEDIAPNREELERHLRTRAQPAPSPADERAAFEAWVSTNSSLPATCDVRGVYVNITVRAWWTAWQARAASANETGAEGVLIERLKLLLSGDAAFCRTIVARAAIEQAIAILSRSPAMAAEAVASPAAGEVYQVKLPGDSESTWRDATESAFAVTTEAHRRIVYRAPQPAQADARVGLTDEQREAIQRAIDYADMSDRDSDAEALRALLATPLPEPRAEATAAARDVLCERRRQAEQEGWTPEHDEKHRDHELSCAAGCYAMHTLAYPAGDPPPAWPWAADWWKPTTHRRNLVKAGALILAEIEKIDRATARSGDAS